MRPNMDAEIVVLQSVLANAKDEHQLKAGLTHAVELLSEVCAYAEELRGLLLRIHHYHFTYSPAEAASVTAEVRAESNFPEWAWEVADALAKNPSPSGLAEIGGQAPIRANEDPVRTDAEPSGPVGLGPVSKCPMCGGPAHVGVRLPDGTNMPAASVTEAQGILRTQQRRFENDLSISVRHATLSVGVSEPQTYADLLANGCRLCGSKSIHAETCPIVIERRK